MLEKEGILDKVFIPEFSGFKKNPRNKFCKVIDFTRLMVEIL
jgi:hypothetical protein